METACHDAERDFEWFQHLGRAEPMGMKCVSTVRAVTQPRANAWGFHVSPARR